MNKIKKVIFKKGNSRHICACTDPYTEQDIIAEGLLYIEWIKLEYQ
jgi:hypothetical protein